MDKMTFNDYLNFMGFDLDRMIDEMYWNGGVNTERLFELVLEHANDNNIELVDQDTVDYDTLLHDIYDLTEKGLS